MDTLKSSKVICLHFEGCGCSLFPLRINGLKIPQCDLPLPLALSREHIWLEKNYHVLQCKWISTCAVFRHAYLGQIPSQIILVPGRTVGSKTLFLGIYRITLWLISQNMEMDAATNRQWWNTAKQRHEKTWLLQTILVNEELCYDTILPAFKTRIKPSRKQEVIWILYALIRPDHISLDCFTLWALNRFSSTLISSWPKHSVS